MEPIEQEVKPVQVDLPPVDTEDTGDSLVEDTEEVQNTLPPHAPSETVIQSLPTSRPLDSKRSDNEVFVILPADTDERIEAALENIPKISASNTQAVRELVEVVEEGYTLRPEGNIFDKSVTRKGSRWEQRVNSQRGTLSARLPGLTDNEGKKLSGAKAVLRIQSYLGQGGIIQIPMWHSGFWITINTPSESELLEVERRIADEKILLGRISNGRVFSNTSVFIAQHIADLLIKKLYDTSLKDVGMVRQNLNTHDLQHIAWGLACSIWPNGFRYARALLGATPEENRVVSEDLNLTKLQWTDTSALTEWQITHMSQRSGSTMTQESIDRYRSEFTGASGKLVQLNDDISILLNVPSIDEYLRSGTAWVNEIVTTNDRLFGMDQDETTRNEFLISQSRATALRQYSHWISGVVMDGGVEYLVKDEPEVVMEMLDKMSANDTIREAVFKAVTDFIEDSTISVIAVPTVDAVEEDKYPKFPHLLPIDALSTFFSLLAQKTRKIRSRV